MAEIIQNENVGEEVQTDSKRVSKSEEKQYTNKPITFPLSTYITTSDTPFFGRDPTVKDISQTPVSHEVQLFLSRLQRTYAGLSRIRNRTQFTPGNLKTAHR
jgi:hypothetical protein